MALLFLGVLDTPLYFLRGKLLNMASYVAEPLFMLLAARLL